MTGGKGEGGGRGTREREDRRCRDRKTIPGIVVATPRWIDLRTSTDDDVAFSGCCCEWFTFHLFRVRLVRRAAIRDRYSKTRKEQQSRVMKLAARNSRKRSLFALGKRADSSGLIEQIDFISRAEKLLRNYRSGEI